MIVPPQAFIKFGVPEIFSVASFICFQPLVPSTYTKVAEIPFVVRSVLLA